MAKSLLLLRKMPGFGAARLRIPVWPRAGRGGKFGQEINAFPCHPKDSVSATKYSYFRVIKKFGIEPIDKTVARDLQKGKKREDFILVENIRPRHRNA